MYENLINHIILWERRLAVENELRQAHLASLALDDEPESDTRSSKKQTYLNWNYHFEKEYQPLLSGLCQSCVANPQLC